MKTSFLFLLFVAFALSGFAQHDFSIKPMKKVDFVSGINKQQSSYLKFDSTEKSPDYLARLTPKKNERKFASILKYRSKMPVAKPKVDMWNMPIAVPDSTVNFAIQEKRIELFVESEKN